MNDNIINDILTRSVENCIPNKQVISKLLKSGTKLNIYLGIDPTATNIHLGHAVPLRKLNLLSQLGHNVIFLIGDFTALIGDTSDKESERPILTSEEIETNFATYKKQAEKLVDFSQIKIVHNSSWLSKLSFKDIVKLTQNFSVNDYLSRELIKKRLDAGKRVGLHEFLYPIMQGYDSYHLDTDIQLGGTDQTFNMQAGRTLQKNLRSKSSAIIANGFLTGTDGRKMSKSWGNAIWLNDAPNDMYGKAMSISDDLIIQYYTLATSLSLDEIQDIKNQLDQTDNPMTIKKRLAHQIVTELHSQKQADSAATHFETTIQQGQIPTSIPEFKLATSSLNLISLCNQVYPHQSNSQIKRLSSSGGIKINGTKITNPATVLEIKNGDVLQYGKRTFTKLHINERK